MSPAMMEQGIPLLKLPAPGSILRSRSPSPAPSGRSISPTPLLHNHFPPRTHSLSPAPVSPVGRLHLEPHGYQPLGHAGRKPLVSPFTRLAVNMFLLNASLCFTVPELFLSFRGLACEIYYETRPAYSGSGDSCAVPEIEAASARELSFMLTIITISSILNVFWTGWVTRKYGVKAALIVQTTSPAIRNIFQQLGLYIRGWPGIRILQYTQVFGVLGCGAGAMLTANTFTTDLVEPDQRTPCYGILQGAMMAGSAVAFTLGGITADKYGTFGCFQVAFGLLVAASLVSFLCLPYIRPPVVAVAQVGAKRDWLAWAAPLRTFKPRVLGNGVRYWGLTCLGIGLFGGVVACEFVPTALQLHSAAAYGFDAKHNGFLLSLNAIARSIFLTIVFPRLIAFGRRWYGDTKFDLSFVRGSMLLDGVLTGLVGLGSSTGWHMYLAAFVLPFASGTSSAAKGVIMELVPVAQRVDALQAVSLLESVGQLSTVSIFVSLLESVGQLSTVSIFGSLFSYLSELGKPQTVFLWNAALALVSAGFLVLVRHPPQKVGVGLA